jgi:hypothetical protein
MGENDYCSLYYLFFHHNFCTYAGALAFLTTNCWIDKLVITDNIFDGSGTNAELRNGNVSLGPISLRKSQNAVIANNVIFGGSDIAIYLSGYCNNVSINSNFCRSGALVCDDVIGSINVTSNTFTGLVLNNVNKVYLYGNNFVLDPYSAVYGIVNADPATNTFYACDNINLPDLIHLPA